MGRGVLEARSGDGAHHAEGQDHHGGQERVVPPKSEPHAKGPVEHLGHHDSDDQEQDRNQDVPHAATAQRSSRPVDVILVSFVNLSAVPPELS